MAIRALKILAIIATLLAATALPGAAQEESTANAIPANRANFVAGSFDDALAGADFAGDLVPFFERTTNAFHHVRYHQVVDGLVVLDTQASHHVALRDDRIRLTHVNVVAGHDRSGSFEYSPADAVRIAEATLGIRVAFPIEAPVVTPAWFPVGDALRKAYSVEIAALDPAGSWRVVLDGETGSLLDLTSTSGSMVEADLGGVPTSLGAPDLERILANARTTTAMSGAAAAVDVPANVHRVSPIVALQDAKLKDNALSIEDGAFNAGRMDVTLKGIRVGMPLQNDDVWVVDALTPGNDVLDLDFRRDDPRFMEVMVVHYVTHSFDILREHGYGDLMSYEQVRALSRVPSPVPNAMASTINGNGYIFMFWRTPTAGNGFVNTAEDGEVIVHELGHLLHTESAPGVSGSWRGAWAEGSADYFSFLFLEGEGLSEGFGEPCVGEWFTTYLSGNLPEYEGLRCIRVLDNDLKYPDDARSSGHFNGQFWSGPNWDIRQEIGQNASIVLFMEALALTPGNLGEIEDFAMMLLAADCGLTPCEREGIIREAWARKNVTAPAIPANFLPDLPVDTLEQAADDGRALVPAPGILVLLGAAGAVAAWLRRRHA